MNPVSIEQSDKNTGMAPYRSLFANRIQSSHSPSYTPVTTLQERESRTSAQTR